MREICEQADQNDMFLLLQPEAFGAGGLTTEQLAAWYARRFGFVELQATPLILVRLPRTAAQQWAAAHEYA
ncbi:conserved hypothetical protein [Ricinus communis]|uniref:Uncharacterized protein n=1 Tax=Ricinus communis TaxID=3988 RepID=B9TJ22_RICCO|nr:conserved hypothetical protein [Ricinus communis]